jgi:hypothetical protein
MAIALVKRIQETTKKIHSHPGYLVVDNNELNILVGKPTTPYFIDVNAWQTPSFHASAIMESVRDRQVHSHEWTQLSDWFSFGIIAFQIYVGVHPYKGRHPDYSPKEWLKRMDDGVSVFNPDVLIPPSCRPMTVIPPAHLRWFKALFEKNERLVPPNADEVLPIAFVSAQILRETAEFLIEKVAEYKENITRVYLYQGETLVQTVQHAYTLARKQSPLRPVVGKTIVLHGPRNQVFACLEVQDLSFYEGQDIDAFHKAKVQAIMERNGRLYGVLQDQIVEYRFHLMNQKLVVSQTKVAGWLPNSSKVFDGGFYENMLGSPAFVIPFASGSTFFGILKELKGYRILDAKAEDNVLVVLTEKNGRYDKFVFVFTSNFSGYDVRTIFDVSVNDVNFTKIPGGPCILVNDDSLEIFVHNQKIRVIDHPPIDTSMKLFNLGGKVYFTSGKELYSFRMKP